MSLEEVDAALALPPWVRVCKTHEAECVTIGEAEGLALRVVCARGHRLTHDTQWKVCRAGAPAGPAWDGCAGFEEEKFEKPKQARPRGRGRGGPQGVSGVRGVTWEARWRSWRVRIGVGGKQLHVGRFNSLKAALEARAKAEKQFWEGAAS